MTRTATSINDLPPELLRAIVHRAAEHSMTKESFVTRLRTLSALSLVNRTIHEITQPLLATIVHVGLTRDRRIFVDKTLGAQVNTLVYNEFPISVGDWVTTANLRSHFEFLQDLRLAEVLFRDWDGLHGHEHLKRLSLEHIVIEDIAQWSECSLPHLEELSLNYCDFDDDHSPGTGQDNLLSIWQFPCLRALALQHVEYSLQGTPNVTFIASDLLPQLECLVTNEIDYHLPSSQTPIRIPYLFDVGSRINMWKVTSTRIRALLSPHQFVRFRLERDMATLGRIKMFLKVARKLVEDVDTLKRLYLELRHEDVMMRLDEYEKMERTKSTLEAFAKEKKVEIVWENYEDDLLKSLVSREFWKRCTEEKRKREGDAQGTVGL